MENIMKWWKIRFEQKTEETRRLKTPEHYLPIFSKYSGMFQVDLMEVPAYTSDEPNFYTRYDRYIACAIEVNSRWAFAVLLKDKKHNSIIDFLEQLKKYYNIRIIESDRGTEFNNQYVIEWCKNNCTNKDPNINNIWFADTSDKHFMGKIERFNRTLKEYLMKLIPFQVQINKKVDKNNFITDNQLQDLIDRSIAGLLEAGKTSKSDTWKAVVVKVIFFHVCNKTK
jgi:hypothetical protein